MTGRTINCEPEPFNLYRNMSGVYLGSVGTAQGMNFEKPSGYKNVNSSAVLRVFAGEKAITSDGVQHCRNSGVDRSACKRIPRVATCHDFGDLSSTAVRNKMEGDRAHNDSLLCHGGD